MTARILSALLALAALVAGWQWYEARIALAEEKAAHQKTISDHALALADGIEQARQADLKTINDQREALNAAQTKTDALRIDRDRAAASSRSLRDLLAAERARASATAADPQAAEGCRATARTASVLADLLERVSEERRELAEYADRARIAGQLCQRSYEALSPP